MRQHTMGSIWADGQRPRILFEDANPALGVSSFDAFREAGFDVTVCSGPRHPIECPVLRGEPCPIVDEADVIVFGPDRLFGVGREVLETVSERAPDAAKLVEVSRRAPDARFSLPQGCEPMPFPMSVAGQVDAVRAALRARTRALR